MAGINGPLIQISGLHHFESMLAFESTLAQRVLGFQHPNKGIHSPSEFFNILDFFILEASSF